MKAVRKLTFLLEQEIANTWQEIFTTLDAPEGACNKSLFPSTVCGLK